MAALSKTFCRLDLGGRFSSSRGGKNEYCKALHFVVSGFSVRREDLSMIYFHTSSNLIDSGLLPPAPRKRHHHQGSVNRFRSTSPQAQPIRPNSFVTRQPCTLATHPRMEPDELSTRQNPLWALLSVFALKLYKPITKFKPREATNLE
ncbi:hypothetical protein ACTXT7_004613 [Hymenolepis weldensis]